MSKYLSVIVPVFNVERYLHKCIKSIADQTFADLEIILVNDGSTDSSPQICDDFAKNDSRVKVIHIKNSGVSMARNIGIEKATGEYITFVDSDDWLELSMYKKMLEINSQKGQIDVIMCDFTNIRERTTEEVSADIRKGFYSKNQIIQELYPTLLVTENFGRIPIISVWSCLFKSTLLKENKILFDADLKYSEDYLFMAEIMTKAYAFYYLKDHYFYNYLQYETSRSKKYQPMWWDNLSLLNKKLNSLLENNQEYNFTRQVKLQLLHSVQLILNSIYVNKEINYNKKLQMISFIMNRNELKTAFSNLKFNQQRTSQKVVLFFIKNSMSLTYLLHRKTTSIIKNV